MERTFIMLKPDAVQRGLVGEVIARFEKKGLKLVGMKLIQVDRALAEAHYAEHRGKGFLNRQSVILCLLRSSRWYGRERTELHWPVNSWEQLIQPMQIRVRFGECMEWILVGTLYTALTQLLVQNVRLLFILNPKTLWIIKKWATNG